ncbi:MAG: DUF3786 domain-containing protein [Anaerolineae bacterium]
MKINPKWEESLELQIQKACEELQQRDPRQVTHDSGAVYYETEEGPDQLSLDFFGQPHTITWPELAIQDAAGHTCANPVQSTLLQYLVLADGTPLAHHWVSLGELPSGTFYEQAFQGYSGNLLARTFKGDLEGFQAAARQIGGEPLSLGDAAFRFWALPRIPLAVVYWSGGDEFPASTQVLFDASAYHYHHLEMLAHLGAMLCKQLIEVHQDN